TPEGGIAHDPDPRTAAELVACDPPELAARFSRPLTFGTAGLRGPVRGGPDAMNVAVVLRATWAVAHVLGIPAGSPVVVGRDARHGSAAFATVTAETFAAQGFPVLLLPGPVPTPVLAFAVRRTGAAAGVQITASHNPPTDNGYKLYLEGGIQIVSPTDREVEAAMAAAPPADQIPRRPVAPAETDLVQRYIERAAGVRRGSGSVRVALTPLHGVGGAVAVEALRRAGFDDVHTVAAQFAPDPDFPTVAFPNPEEPGATDALLDLAGQVGADVAIALDPDADRCAVGIPTESGWRMLSGDETGWLLGDYILSGRRSGTAVVASSVVSSRMLAAIAAHYGAVHVETRTGFKWLARADADVPGGTLVYAYEEAIGHCVDPQAVRDKDGISAAVLVCDLVATLQGRGRSVPDRLDELALRHGVHDVAALSRRVDAQQAAAQMRRLRASPPAHLARLEVTITDLSDALIFTGSDGDTSVRVVVRPSGTEPKIKCYLEIRCTVTDGLGAARRRAGALRDELLPQVRELIG
ncbi:MAG: phospho-sugar mutase, partial [Mycobacterium sp.]|nr:phospho-sugar mutase [Mycobacterium sp.]